MSRRLLLSAAVLAAAVVAIQLATLPPAPVAVDVSTWVADPGVTAVPGAYHVHTARSDGAGTPDEVALAAAAAGLRFVVLTDHGDATREPAPPAYLQDVLIIDAVEISTTGGHYVALDLPAAPYPLAGEPRDVAEDVARLGGFGIAAHPTSAKPALEWTDWSVPFDGLEWLNADSEWRDETWMPLLRMPLGYLVRPAPALVSLLDRPDLALARWDALLARRRVVGLAAHDAHGHVGLRGREDPYGDLGTVAVPSYDSSFRAFAVRVELDAPLTGDAAADAQAVVGAIRGGRVFSGIDAIAAPVHLAFSATSGSVTARQGQTLLPAGRVTITVRTVMPAGGGEVVLLQDGTVVRSASAGELVHEADAGRAAFRAEVRLPGAPGTPRVPWIVSNPIYIGPRAGEGDPVPPRLPATTTQPLYVDSDVERWTVELDPESRAAVDATVTPEGSRELAFRYALRGSPAASQYAALVHPVDGGLTGWDRLQFRARASRPMRLEVQIRLPGERGGQRWYRSVYLDGTPRAVTVFFDELVPIGVTKRRRPDLALIDTVLFVVDANHTPPATAGIVWLDDVALGRR